MKYVLVCFIFSVLLTSANATKIAVISDMNSSYGSVSYHPAIKRTIDNIINDRPDLVISTGDMIAGQKLGLNYRAMWDSFHKEVTIPLKSNGIPFATTPGNHDGSLAIKFKIEREIYRDQWKKYRPNLNYINDDHYPDYYAFSFKNILFISLDATLVGEISVKQKLWLENVLKENSNFDYKIAYGHLPFYPTVKSKAHEILNDLSVLNLFKKYKLTAYLSGHHHAYYPGISKNGIMHISQGALGSGPRILEGTNKRSKRSYTLIDIDEKFRVDALDAESGFKVINKKSLPRKIQIGSYVLQRIYE